MVFNKFTVFTIRLRNEILLRLILENSFIKKYTHILANNDSVYSTNKLAIQSRSYNCGFIV